VEVVQEPGVALQADLRAVGERSVRRAVSSAVRTRRIAYGGAAVYSLLFVGAAIAHVASFRAGRADLGHMVQAVWSTSHGHFLETTTLSGRQMTRLGGHVDPFLALLTPLWWLWSSPLMLLVVQAVAVSTGALPVYWLARKHLRSERAAAHFAFAYLLYPATQFNALTITSGFHAVSIAVPLILFAIWFLDEGRLAPFAVFALLAASTKEEIAAAVGCLGIWYAVRKGKRLLGLSIFALGAGVTLVNFLVIIPHFSPSGIDPFAGRYGDVGATPTGILHKALTDPGALVHAVATGHKLVYVGSLLVPLLGLCLLEPLLLLGAVPDLAINLLSDKGDQTVIAYHWTAGIVPFVVAASIFGAARLKRNADRVSLYALVGAGCLAVISPLTLGLSRGDVAAALPSNPVRAAKAHALHLIPGGVPVSASNQLGTYVSARRYVYTFPFSQGARWVIVDRNDDTYADAAGYRRAVRKLDSEPGWKVVYAARGIRVMHKVSGSS
jgi:uncharacterized membrane protein